MKEPIKITKAQLEKQVNDGMKKADLAKFYDLPVSQVTKLLQQAGLRIRKFGHPKFELVDEETLVENIEVKDELLVFTELQDDVFVDLEEDVHTPIVNNNVVNENVSESIPSWEN